MWEGEAEIEKSLKLKVEISNVREDYYVIIIVK